MRKLITMCEADRDKFGGTAELVYDHEQVLDLDAGDLEAIEAETGRYIDTFCQAIELGARTAWVKRMTIWLARRQLKLIDPWDDFKPHLLRTDIVDMPEEQAALPPAEASTPADS